MQQDQNDQAAVDATAEAQPTPESETQITDSPSDPVDCDAVGQEEEAAPHDTSGHAVHRTFGR